MTKAQRSALGWLAEHGGHGRLDRYGNLIAISDGAKAPNASVTFLRLVMAGYCCKGMLADSLGITIEGINAK